MLIIILFILAFFIRALPIWMSPQGAGVDNWYWRLYIETYRKEKKFPPDLKQYILEYYQWYPPLFPLLISKVPPKIYDRYCHVLSIIIDLFRFALLLIIAVYIYKNNIAVMIAGFSYIFTPILVSYNIQLNPRGLGAFLLDLLIVLILIFYFNPIYKWLVIPIIILSGLILLTHKMTTQIFWFLIIATSIITKEWKILPLLPISIISAVLLSCGFYWKVLKAHWDIVTFWYRNWQWLQSHPILESPIYGKNDFESPTKFHKKGFNGLFQHMKYLFGFSPSTWILCLIAINQIIYVFYSVITYGNTMFIILCGWLCLIIIFALLTVFVPLLKCLGSGYLYLYNSVIPASLLWAEIVYNGDNDIRYFVLFFMAILFNIIIILNYYKRFLLSKTQRVDNNFNDLLEYLNQSPDGVVMCLPYQWYDIIAYKTGKPVLFGGHGYGFKLLEPVFPRILIPFTEIKLKYNISYLVTLEDYLNEKFSEELRDAECIKFGPYRLYLL